jgi:hypothetical protein
MVGRPHEKAARARLDATFGRIRAVPEADLELRSDFARYLCVLVSGYTEAAIAALTINYCSRQASPSVNRYLSTKLGRLQNLKAQKLLDLVGAFDSKWREQLAHYIEGARRDALDSVVDLKNQIAHGNSVGVTYTRIETYYERVKEIVDFVASMLS